LPAGFLASLREERERFGEQRVRLREERERVGDSPLPETLALFPKPD
jgi:hypothetical protein